MKKWLTVLLSAILCFGFVFALPSCAGETKPAAVKTLLGEDFLTDEPYVKWEGRYDYTAPEGNEPGKINLYHTASGFTVDFTGTELYVEFDCTVKDNSKSRYPYYNIAVDDEVIPTLSPDRTFHLTGGRERIKIVDGLSEGRHTVKCLKMSEPYDALTSIVVMETDGSFIKRDVEYDNGNFRFMVVCASGGSGHGSLAYSDNIDARIGRNTENSSSLHAFSYLTARIFGADVQFVANSGWGVAYGSGTAISKVLDYSGITTSNNVSGATQTALWDYQKWIPDVILFNIGGNDTTNGSFNQSKYQKEVVAMVEKLHSLYPNAYMVWTHTNSNAGKYAISAMSDAGILRNGYLKEAIIPKVGAKYNEEVMGVGANDHNSIKSHIVTADILAQTLQETWGFMPLYPNITFEEYEGILQKF